MEFQILSVYIKHDSHHLHDKHRNPLYIVHIAFDAMLNPYFQRNRSEPQQKTKSVGRSSCIGTNTYIFMYSSQEGFLHLFWVGVCVFFPFKYKRKMDPHEWQGNGLFESWFLWLFVTLHEGLKRQSGITGNVSHTHIHTRGTFQRIFQLPGI